MLRIFELSSPVERHAIVLIFGKRGAQSEVACGASPQCSLGGVREGDHVLVTLAATQWTQARTSTTPTEHEFWIHILQRIENLLGRDTEKGGRQRWPRQSNREVPRCPPAGQDGFARVSGAVLRKWSAKRQERERRACPAPPSASERRSTPWRRCPSAFVRPNKALPKEHWGGATTASGSNARKHEKEKKMESFIRAGGSCFAETCDGWRKDLRTNLRT